MPTQLIDLGDRLLAEVHGAAALFTGRPGGTSEAPFDSLNLGPRTGDRSEAVIANTAIARGWASADRSRKLVIGTQVHETVVVQHRAGFPDPETDGVDGHVTDRGDVALAVLTADCMPVALLAPWGVGIVHAGWRGLAGGIVAQGVDELRDLPGAEQDASSVVAVVGPCAGPCCYEVGDDVRAVFAGWPGADPDGATLDLPALARAALEHAGVGEIVLSGHCTMCEPRWFSHRASGGRTGRQAGIVWRAGS